MSAVTPASCLRIAEALPTDAADFPIIRELVAALKELVTITEAKEPQP